MPAYETEGASAMDIAASEARCIAPGEVVNVPTGLYLEVPKGFCALLFARSSLHKKKLMLANSVGVIDSDYRGEVKVPVFNFSNDTHATIEQGERIAQIAFVVIPGINWQIVQTLSETARGCGGFGSTGK